MRKAKYALPMLAFLVFNSVLSQNKVNATDSCFKTKELSGFVVYVYSKSEINKRKRNIRNKEHGQAFSLNIDNVPRIIFITAENAKNTFPDEIRKYLSGKAQDLFIPYSAVDYFGLNKFNLTCLDSLRESPFFPLADELSDYIQVKTIPKYYFRFLYVNASWVTIVMTQDAVFELITKEAKVLDPAEKTYRVYVLKKINAISQATNSDLRGLGHYRKVKPN